MMKSKTMERLMRFLLTLLGVGVGVGLATLISSLFARSFPEWIAKTYTPLLLYGGLCVLGALFFFLISGWIIRRIMQAMAAIERRWDRIPASQIFMATMGLILGLLVAYLTSHLILSAGPSLITLTFSAIVYLFLGILGMQMGFRRYREGGGLAHGLRRRNRLHDSGLDGILLSEEDEGTPDLEASLGRAPKKVLDTSVIIDGRVLDIAKAGFLEGSIVIPRFVLAELQHIADSSDALRRARGRRGLEVLSGLQKEFNGAVMVDETDYEDTSEVDVKLLRLCRDIRGVVVTNDYNLNKVAEVSGMRVLNINELSNAVKPMVMAGEEMAVQIVREGKEPGQGVGFLDDGTMIVVENGRRHVGENVPVIVATVLQTSAGRMIFSKLKNMEE